MRELDQFNLWADNIVESAIFEKKAEDSIKREIPKTQDIVYQAKRKYPDRGTEEALSLFLADKLEDFDRRDLEQNAVINAQRRENQKLNANLGTLQQELSRIETSGQETDAEIQRLKALSTKLTTDVEQREISAKELNRALAQVEELRNKPGMSEKKYEELKKKIEDAQQNRAGINREEFEKFSSQIAALNTQQSIEKEQLFQLEKIASELQSGEEKSSKQKIDLDKVLNKIQHDMNSQKVKIEDQLDKLQAKETELQNSINLLGEKTKKIDAINELATDANEVSMAYIDVLSSKVKKIEKSLPGYVEPPPPPPAKEPSASLLALIRRLKSGGIRNVQGDSFNPEQGSTGVNEAIDIFKINLNEDLVDYYKFQEKELIDLGNTINNSLNSSTIEDKRELLQYKIVLTYEEFIDVLFYSVYVVSRKIKSGESNSSVIAKIILRKFKDSWWKKLHTSYNDPEYYKILNYVQKRMERLLTSARATTAWNLNWLEDKPIFIDQWDQLMNELAPRKRIHTKHRPRFWSNGDEDDFPSTQFDYDDNSDFPRFSRTRFEESIDHMIDNIIGEQVARWIK